jgi:hypothetical protein
MYKIFMIVAVPALIIGWLIYWWWNRKMEEEEKKQPKQVSERLTKTRTEMADWAKKMAEYKPPTQNKPSDQPQQDKPK